MNTTFDKLLKGDIIYEVDLSGNMKTHIIKKLYHQGDYLIIEWHDNLCSIPMRYSLTYGYGGYFVIRERAIKLANSRKKYELKEQIKVYQNQIAILQKK